LRACGVGVATIPAVFVMLRKTFGAVQNARMSPLPPVGVPTLFFGGMFLCGTTAGIGASFLREYFFVYFLQVLQVFLIFL
jgi:hypothetical protein